MAERSLKREGRDVRSGAGDAFTGEGIVAIAKAVRETELADMGGYTGALATIRSLVA